MTREEALRFAEGWAAAWNARDLDCILAHYSDDFEMTTPFIVTLVGEPTGTLQGKDQVGAYWRRAVSSSITGPFWACWRARSSSLTAGARSARRLPTTTGPNGRRALGQPLARGSRRAVRSCRRWPGRSGQ